MSSKTVMFAKAPFLQSLLTTPIGFVNQLGKESQVAKSASSREANNFSPLLLKPTNEHLQARSGLEFSLWQTCGGKSSRGGFIRCDDTDGLQQQFLMPIGMPAENRYFIEWHRFTYFLSARG
jgi:hypothetical protein